MKKIASVVLLVITLLLYFACSDVENENELLISEICNQNGYIVSRNIIISNGEVESYFVTNDNMNDVEILIDIFDTPNENDDIFITLSNNLNSINSKIEDLKTHLNVVCEIVKYYCPELTQETLYNFLYKDTIGIYSSEDEYVMLEKTLSGDEFCITYSIINEGKNNQHKLVEYLTISI